MKIALDLIWKYTNLNFPTCQSSNLKAAAQSSPLSSPPPEDIGAPIFPLSNGSNERSRSSDRDPIDMLSGDTQSSDQLTRSREIAKDGWRHVGSPLLGAGKGYG